MELDFDPAKNAANIRDRGLPFSLVEGFEFETALIWQHIRKIYPEVRFSALGLISDRIYSLVFTETPMGIRVISFRKANEREVRHYEQETQS